MEKVKMSKKAKRKSSSASTIGDEESTKDQEPSQLDITKKISKGLFQRRKAVLKRDLKIKDVQIAGSYKLVPGAIPGSSAKSFHKKYSDVRDASVSTSRATIGNPNEITTNVSTSQIATTEIMSKTDLSPQITSLTSLWRLWADPRPYNKPRYNSVNITLPVKTFRSQKVVDNEEKKQDKKNVDPFSRHKKIVLNTEDTIPWVSKQMIQRKPKPKPIIRNTDTTLRWNSGKANANPNLSRSMSYVSSLKTATFVESFASAISRFSKMSSRKASNSLMKRRQTKVRPSIFRLPDPEKKNTTKQHYELKKTQIYGNQDEQDKETNTESALSGSHISSTVSKLPRGVSDGNVMITLDPETFVVTRFRWAVGKTVKKKMREKRPAVTPPKENVSKWFTGYFFISSSSDSIGLRPDSSWLIKCNKEDEQEMKNDLIPDAIANRTCFMLAFLPYWLSLFTMGRLPFHFAYDREQRIFVCNMKYNDIRFRYFLVSSVFIFLTCLLYNFSILYMSIAANEAEEDEPYNQLELLLFDKHWLSMMIHEIMLIVATITTLKVLKSGEAISKFITDFDISCNKLHYDPYKGVSIYSYIDVFSFVATNIVTFSLFYFNLCGMKESVELNTIIYFRLFIKNLYFQWYFRYLCWIVLVVQAYMTFCARSFIHMLVFYCVSIRSLAHQWNMQASRFIKARAGSDVPLTLEIYNEDDIQHIPRFTHEMLFDHHVTITDLVREASKRFSMLILVYYISQVLEFTFAGLSLSTIYLLREHNAKFNSSEVEHLEHHVAYVDTVRNRFEEVIYYMILTIIEFIFTTTSISSVGETIMQGSHVIRKFNLMRSKTTKDRRLTLSMEMSLSRRHKPCIRPGGYFGIDREFIVNIMIGTLFLTSLLIQLQLEPLITQPIVFECNNTASGLCLGVKKVSPLQFKRENLAIDITDPILSPKSKDHKGTTATITTTTMKPIDPQEVIELPKLNERLKPLETALDKTTAKTRIQSSVQYDTLCKEYCPGTLVQRIVLYDSQQKKLDFPKGIAYCVFNPYRDLKARNSPPLSDCTSTRLNDGFDNCDMPKDLNPYYDGKNQRENLISISLKLRNDRCYARPRGDIGVSIKTLHPLEVAQMPYFGLRYLGTDKAFDLIETPIPKSVKTDPEMQGLVCAEEETGKNYEKVSNENDYFLPVNHPQQGTIMQRPYAFAFRKDEITCQQADCQGTGEKMYRLKIPLPLEFPEQLIRPYAYLPPQYIKGKAYEYYDCFGYPLVDFDDCGYLPFSLIVEGQSGKLVRKTPVKETVTLPDGNKFQCYESWNPAYKCGVPSKYIKFVCDQWKSYIQTDYL